MLISVMTVISTFLGIMVGVNLMKRTVKKVTYDGVMKISWNPDTGKLLYSLELNDDVEDLGLKESISFKVVPRD